MVMESDIETSGFQKRLTELLEPVVRSEGLILVELIWHGEAAGQILRLFVDRPEGGVTLDECTLVSRQISHLLDVEDLIEQKFRLEVSSPGLTRRLKTARDFEIFAGRKARLVVKDDDQGRTEVIKGRLKGVSGSDVLVEASGKMRALPLSTISKANLALDNFG